MAAEMTPERRRLAAALEARAISMRDASLRIGRNEAYVQQWIEYGRPKRLAEDDRFALAEIAGLDESELRPPGRPVLARRRHRGTAIPAGMGTVDPAQLPNDVPVRGTAAAAFAGGHGGFVIAEDTIDWVRRPPGLLTARDVYAIYVRGDSMMPAFAPGALVFVRPGRDAGVGDFAIIQIRHRDGGDIEAYIKRIARADNAWLTVEQFNPVATMKLLRKSIVAVHRVLTTNELFGV